MLLYFDKHMTCFRAY